MPRRESATKQRTTKGRALPSLLHPFARFGVDGDGFRKVPVIPMAAPVAGRHAVDHANLASLYAKKPDRDRGRHM
jgi:hypothetical protein